MLNRDDYEEPRCLLNMDVPGKAPVDPVDLGRVIAKFDDYLSRNDKAGAERHLLYWLSEARAGRDRRGEHSLKNELMGFYRKEGREKEAVSFAQSALDDLEELGLADTATAGTCLVNAGTVYFTFHRPGEALPYLERARVLYETHLSPEDPRLGGLYNNTALTLTDLGRFDEALALYEKALDIMAKKPTGVLEEAITHLNMADTLTAGRGIEDAEKDVEEHLAAALKLLDTPDVPRDGYYAFVCEKCATVFGYYGHFLTQADLNARAKEIYERA
ncbi:MAG: tetratricopeptide repeat protein [Clostridia bacterium]|nr:tetratricopeptide repeat protein [Clostridia bacterium]